VSTDNGTQDDLEPKINRALPQIYIDLLLDGPPCGEAAPMANIYSCLVSVAMSAYRRGWTEIQFLDEVTARSRVGSGGRRRWRERRLWVLLKSHRNSEAAAMKTLQKAWSAAVANLNDIGERSKVDVRDDAIERAYLWADRITDRLDGLSDTEAAVLGYVVSQTEQRGMTRVTCPARAVAEYAKVSTMTAHRSLEVLLEKGLLVRHSRGRPGKPGNRRAAIYSLSDPTELPLVRALSSGGGPPRHPTPAQHRRPSP
jgi:predicted transcriptional regulator